MKAEAGVQATLQTSVRLEVGESCASIFDDRWDELVRSQPLPNPTLSSTWLHHLLEWEQGQPLAVTVEQDDALVAAGAFGLYRPFGRRGPTFARWLGDFRQWYSPDLLVDPATRHAGEAVVDALLGRGYVLHLPVAENGAAAAALRARAPWLAKHPGPDGWVTPLPAPRMALARKRQERDARRASRRGAEIAVRLASTPGDVAAALERLFALHAARWQMRGGEIPRFSTTELHRAWYRRVVTALAERDEALIAEVLENGELYAAELALHAGRGGILHTTAIALGGKLEQPGRVPQLHLLQALEETGVQAVDLGWGACEPGSPKASLGPTEVVWKRIVAADSPRVQRAMDAAMSFRDRVQGLRSMKTLRVRR